MDYLNVEAVLLGGIVKSSPAGFIVNKYCVALRNPTGSECRVRVGEFPDSARAFQLAELMALELGAESGARWSGWTVEVRSVQGQRLFATQVGTPHSVPA
jgi:hypothetical protein